MRGGYEFVSGLVPVGFTYRLGAVGGSEVCRGRLQNGLSGAFSGCDLLAIWGRERCRTYGREVERSERLLRVERLLTTRREQMRGRAHDFGGLAQAIVGLHVVIE